MVWDVPHAFHSPVATQKNKESDISISTHVSGCSTAIPISSTDPRVTAAMHQINQRSRRHAHDQTYFQPPLCRFSQVGHRTGKRRNSICDTMSERTHTLQNDCPPGSTCVIVSSGNLHAPSAVKLVLRTNSEFYYTLHSEHAIFFIQLHGGSFFSIERMCIT
jgi:hypothetical protein